MRSRRIRSRFSRPLPKPELVIEETTQHRDGPEIDVASLEPSRARERDPYEASTEDNDAFVRVVEELLDATELEYEVEFEHGEYQRAFVSVGDRQAGALIGKRGSGLEALETLLGRMTSHQVGHAVPVQVDVNEYRARHEDELRGLARDLARRVLDSGKDEHLEPMSARDRRVVHLAVQEFKGLQTYSVGHGATKHIVIHRLDKNDE